MVNNNTRSKLNPIIARNHLFFYTGEARVTTSDDYIGSNYGNLYSINLVTGELKNIYTEHYCVLSSLYNGIIYGREFVKSVQGGQGILKNFQINIDGTDKKNIQF